MKIKLTSVYVDDQEKALRFYTEVLGFAKKADFSQGPYRWLTVASPEDPDGTELQLALNDNPAAKAYQQAMFQQGQPAAMFFSDDVKGDYERIKARGAEFTMAPTQVTGSTIAKLNDTCGNLIQITQLALVGQRIGATGFEPSQHRCLAAVIPAQVLRRGRHFAHFGPTPPKRATAKTSKRPPGASRSWLMPASNETGKEDQS